MANQAISADTSEAERETIAKSVMEKATKKVLEEVELKALIRDAQKGSTESFGKIYDLFFLPVYRYTAFRLPEDVSEDTVSDIFVKAWEKIHTYKPHRSVPFSAWLFRIARHTVIDVYRGQRGFEEIPENMEDPDQCNRAEYRAQKRDVLTIMRSAISKLPRRYRETLLLLYVSELSNEEVAKILHITTGGVRILKMRALKKLEALLPPEMEDFV
jgi:RNA polymerase sigma-70 factor, ECF subfamily